MKKKYREMKNEELRIKNKKGNTIMKHINEKVEIINIEC
jgi:hypothetical protein